MKQLAGFHFSSDKKYRAKLTADLVLDLGMGYRGYHVFAHEETRWGMLNNDVLTIFAGYASDLCSPGIYVFGVWLGTPSRGMELEAFVHDFLRQFMSVPCVPWDRKSSDAIFYNAGIMRGHNMKIKVYHGAVAGKLGDLWMWLNKERPEVSCTICESKI